MGWRGFLLSRPQTDKGEAMGEQVEDDADIVVLLKDLVYGEHINLKAAEVI